MEALREKLQAFDGDLPLEKARTIPASWYFDPEVYEAERRGIFGTTWQAIARADQLTERGSFVTTEIAGEPVVVVRGDDGVLRAFANVCRHRAARVVNEPSGKLTKLRCRYHGWTYDLSGQLRGTPEFDGVLDFCREEQGLPELAVDSWGPLVFVRLEDSDGPSLARFLTPLPEHGSTLELNKLQFFARREYDLACNWKVFVDNYLDGGYHVNTVHPGLAGVLDYSQYRTEIAGNTSVQISPLKPSDGSAAAQTGQVRKGESAFYWWIYPNLMLNLYEGIMDTNLVIPLSPGRCRVIFDFYFADIEGPSARAFAQQSIAIGEQIQQEDVGICEEVQQGLASRTFDTGRFSVKREAAGYHFHRLLALSLRNSSLSNRNPNS
jgi:choline monooxygenase